jgi:predicted phage tail component-like protein
MDGLTFNEKHSYNDFGLIMKSDNRNARPSLVKREIEIDGKDGTWNFGSNRYTNRQIQVTFYYPSTNRVDLRVKMRKIAQWLNCKTASMLIFDDEIDKEYIAMVYDEINIEEIGNDAKFTVTFDCQPIAELIY